jgi:tRNA dimethylallyltransferase
MPAPIPVLLLCGPTASGKTAVLEGLFAGPRALCPAEVVSADSMQVYRGMDIGTAKPGADLLAALPHHLIDIRSPGEQFNAGDFVRLAAEAVADIAGRGKLPVISGGTGFYLNCFVRGLPSAPPSDPEIRRVLKEELRERGRDALYEELAGTDPVSAGRIHRNDEYRLLRALEVRRLSGRPLSDFKAPWPGDGRQEGFARQDYRFLMIGLSRPREEVYRRIDERCAAMFRAGLPAEVRGLFEAGFGPEAPGMRAIGYREFFVGDGAPRFTGDMAPVEALVARNSRRYAKRQLTYFASLPALIRVDAGPGAAGELSPLIRAFLSGPAGGSAAP